MNLFGWLRRRRESAQNKRNWEMYARSIASGQPLSERDRANATADHLLKHYADPRQLVSMPGYELWSDGSGKLGQSAVRVIADDDFRGIRITQDTLTISGEVIGAGAVSAPRQAFHLYGSKLVSNRPPMYYAIMGNGVPGITGVVCGSCGCYYPVGTYKCQSCGAPI